jgi:hypothetical protein
VTIISIKLSDFQIEIAPQLGLTIENRPLPNEVATALGCTEGDLFSLSINADSGGEHGLYALVWKAVAAEDDRALFSGGCVKVAFNHCLIHAQVDPKALDYLVSAAIASKPNRVLSLDMSMISSMEDLMAAAKALSFLPEHLRVEAKGALFLPQIRIGVSI